MGFNEGRIILDSENGAYYAGQMVQGRLVFNQGKEKTIHGISISFKGFCKVHWTTSHTRRTGNRTERYTENHDSYEEYMENKIFIIGGADGETQLDAGNHEFHFQFHIPAHCPSSFEGNLGHIRYRVKAVMLTTGMFTANKEKKAAIQVYTHTDLNQNPYCKEPIECQILQSFCCWCFNSGSVQIKVKIPRGGYCPGQVILIEVDAKNNSSIEISEIELAIIKKIRYIAESKPGSREEEEDLLMIKKGPVPGNSSRNWTVEMEVPAIHVGNFTGCRFIDVDYFFKVSTDVSGCHQDEDETRKIILGTIPLVGYQDNIANPLHDQMPKHMQQLSSYPQPMVTQPLPASPYPNNQPYPNSTPYPAPNSPYPTTPNLSAVPPYPNTPVQLPYPNGANQAYQTPLQYPANNPNQIIPPYPTVIPATPYQGGNSNPSSPYPPASQPYPAADSPYPAANSPYPAANSPYPAANSPYPAANSPYPAANSPYPAANSPYPLNSNSGGTVPPYSRNTPSPVRTTLLKTGTLGFGVEAGDSATIPLLPMGANVPYPLTPANPYATASAPEPATPDSVDKNLDMGSPTCMTTNPSPYNPQFLNSEKKDEQ